jgi:hypothetical protein
MVSSLLSFFLIVIITNVYFSLVSALLFLKLDKNKILPTFQLLIFSFGLGPFFCSLLLYYLLWLVPGKPPLFYTSVIISFFVILHFLLKNEIPNLLKVLKERFKIYFKNDIFNKNKPLVDLIFFKIYPSKYNLHYLNFFFIIVILYFGLKNLMQIIEIPIMGHDMLEYAIQAKYFGKQKIIEYVSNRFHAENKFYYVGLHGFSFPLLGTWEYIFNETIGFNFNDFYFKSITSYYAMLILLIQFYWVKKTSFLLAVFSNIMLFLTYGFYITIYEYHIDTFRIFMSISSFIALAYAVENSKQNFAIILLGIFCGAQAFIHSFGVFISVFLVLSFFIFSNENWFNKIKKSLTVTSIVLLMGGIHYIFDVFFGTGWIFQEIKFY